MTARNAAPAGVGFVPGRPATIFCSADTTTTLMWRVAFLQRNMSTTLWRWRVCAIQPSALRTCADQI